MSVPRLPGWFNERLPDGGPVYMETQEGQLIVEPWNAISSLLILVPAIFWIYKMKKEGDDNPFMWLVIILIIIGGLGSTLFHAFRTYSFFLYMDVIPTGLLTISLAIYFWLKVLKRWWYILIVYLPFLISRFVFWNRLPDFLAINLSYFISGASIGVPLIIYLVRTRFTGWWIALSGIAFFFLALTFRQLDSQPISLLPMGTHFLWHTFAAAGAFFILKFLYNTFKRSHESRNQKESMQKV